MKECFSMLFPSYEELPNIQKYAVKLEILINNLSYEINVWDEKEGPHEIVLLKEKKAGLLKTIEKIDGYLSGCVKELKEGANLIKNTAKNKNLEEECIKILNTNIDDFLCIVDKWIKKETEIGYSIEKNKKISKEIEEINNQISASIKNLTELQGSILKGENQHFLKRKDGVLLSKYIACFLDKIDFCINVGEEFKSQEKKKEEGFEVIYSIDQKISVIEKKIHQQACAYAKEARNLMNDIENELRNINKTEKDVFGDIDYTTSKSNV